MQLTLSQVEGGISPPPPPQVHFLKYLKNALSYGFETFWQFKGSVERSLLPWVIFFIFTRNRPWKCEDHLCALFFIEVSKERLEKSERTLPFSWRHWALVYSRDRPYNFSCLSAVSKNRRFRSFFSALGVIWRGKPFCDQQCQFLSRNKSLSSKNELNCSMTSECARTDSILPRGAGFEHGGWKQSIFSFQFSAFWSNDLASCVFNFAPILLQFFFIVFVYARGKI